MDTYTVKTPVLVIFYNRDQKAKNIIKNLLNTTYQFSKIYFSIDGPKNLEDQKKVDKVIKIINSFKIKFKKVELIIRKENLGLQKNIIQSIDYVLHKNETVIVLEDDHIVSPKFFDFCDLMLEKFKDNEKIFSVAGTCYLPDDLKQDEIFLTKFPDCVGWATWRNKWGKLIRKFSFFEIYKKKLINKYYKNFSMEHWFYEYLYRECTALENKGLWSTWWQLSIIYENGLSVNPMRNLTIHDGLDKDANAVHFDESYAIKKKLSCETININKISNYNKNYDQNLDKYNFEIIKKTDPVFKFLNRIKWLIKFIPRLYGLKGSEKSINS